MGATNWLPGIIALAIGLGAGIAFVLSRRRTPDAPALPPEARDLAAGRELLVARLREMTDATDPASARERYRLEQEAARLTLALEASGATAPASPAPAAPATRSSMVPFVWGVAAASAVFGLVLWVMSQSAPRAAGGSITGNAQLEAGAPDAAAAAPDPALDEVRSFAESHPDNATAQLDLAQALLQRDQMVPAFEAAQKALAKDPENARGLTYTAAVRSAMGQGDMALGLLDKAVQRDPTLAEGWVYRGLVAADLGKYQVAIESWEKAVQLRPDGAEVIRGPLERVRQLAKEQAAGGAAPAKDDALPAGHPDIGTPAPPLPPAAAGGGVKALITLAPGVIVPPGASLFVTVRPDGQDRGPPVAAKRLPAQFPAELSIGPADSMMGLPWPEHATVEARVDADGNAMTREPSDPIARSTGVAAGASLQLVLKTP